MINCYNRITDFDYAPEKMGLLLQGRRLLSV